MSYLSVSSAGHIKYTQDLWNLCTSSVNVWDTGQCLGGQYLSVSSGSTPRNVTSFSMKVAHTSAQVNQSYIFHAFNATPMS